MFLESRINRTSTIQIQDAGYQNLEREKNNPKREQNCSINWSHSVEMAFVLRGIHHKIVQVNLVKNHVFGGNWSILTIFVCLLTDYDNSEFSHSLFQHAYSHSS